MKLTNLRIIPLLMVNFSFEKYSNITCLAFVLNKIIFYNLKFQKEFERK